MTQRLYDAHIVVTYEARREVLAHSEAGAESRIKRELKDQYGDGLVSVSVMVTDMCPEESNGEES